MLVFREINPDFVSGVRLEVGEKLMEINEEFVGEVMKSGAGY